MKNRLLKDAVLILSSIASLTGPAGSADEARAGRPEHLLFQALRRGDSALVASLLRQGTPADLRGEDGATPLLLAARYRDPECVKLLLDHGADPNAANGDGATALHWGVGSLEVVRLLLDRWADPRAVTKLGNTPLISAAGYPGSGAVVKLLLEKGADPHAWNKAGETALTQAVQADDLEVVNLLADRGAVKSLAGRPEGKHNQYTLLRVASQCPRSIAEVLLDHGAEIDQSDGAFTGHGLNAALFKGNAEVARLLIERGADLNLKSPIGQVPPMVWSAYFETEDTSVAEMLLKKGADVNAANEYGETALDWARKRGHRRMADLLLRAGAREPAPAEARKVPNREPDPEPGARARQIVSAVEKSLRLLQRSSDRFLEQRECVSCHHQFLPAIALGWARDRGFRLDEESLRRQIDRQVKLWSARKSHARELQAPVPVPPHFLGAGLWGLAAVGHPADDLTEAMTAYLASTQRAAGHWISGNSRPPLDEGDIPATVKALRALQVYPVGALRSEFAERVARARDWLVRAEPATHTDRFYRLLGLRWSGAEAAIVEAGAREIVSAQREDGGWAQLPGLESDAWATAGALVALHAGGGLPATHPVYRRGVEFLLRTQFEDGSWWVRSRSWPFQTQFDSRFPYGRDQWISAGATALAVMALVPAVEPATVAVALNGAGPGPAPRREETSPAATHPGTSTAAVDFVRDLKPVLERSCLGCHSGPQPKSAYRLTTREGMLRGGESGKAAIIPGQAANSPLIQYVSGQVAELEMPPLGKRDRFPPLTSEEIRKLRDWIDGGALLPEGLELRLPAD